GAKFSFMTKSLKWAPGKLISKALERSWAHEDPGELELSVEEFDQVTPLLYESGAPGLGWWRIRNSRLRHTKSGELLRQAHRLLTLRAAIHETHIQKIFRVLRSGGVDPILIKGWAIARLYPHPALRPYGDVDLLIRPGDYRIALQIMADE